MLKGRLVRSRISFVLRTVLLWSAKNNNFFLKKCLFSYLLLSEHRILWKVSHWELIRDDWGRFTDLCTDHFSPILYEQWERGCPSFVSGCISITPSTASSGLAHHIKHIVLEQGNGGSNSPARGALRAAQPPSAETYKPQIIYFLPRKSFYPCKAV